MLFLYAATAAYEAPCGLSKNFVYCFMWMKLFIIYCILMYEAPENTENNERKIVKNYLNSKLQRGDIMRKLVLATMLITMSIALVGCGKEEEQLPSESVSEEISADVSEEVSVDDSEVSEENAVVSDNGSVDILTGIWNAFAEEEKFPAMGGDYATMVDGAPGAFDVTNTMDLEAMLYVPATIAGDIDEGASLLHGMNLNTFTGAALHLSDVSKAETFTTALKENILGTQWMCGFPDVLVIYTVNDEYVVYAFGNIDAINTFKAKVAEVYGDNAVLVAEENLAG